MAEQGDTGRPRFVKAEIDPDFDATPNGGAVMFERVARRLGIWRMFKEHLPERGREGGYASHEGAYALFAGLLLGGQGIAAVELLRANALDAEVFGLVDAVPGESTLYRILCDMVGLDQRTLADAYRPAGSVLPRFDIFGNEVAPAGLRRLVPDAPEEASAESRRAFEALTEAVAARSLAALAHKVLKLHGFYVRFGDATDLEVEGSCFDAARVGRDGKRAMRLFSLRLGPVTIAHRLAVGNTDEGNTLPELVRATDALTRKTVGRTGRVLDLNDSAYFERGVIETYAEHPEWRFVIGANQIRGRLERLAAEQPESQWVDVKGVEAVVADAAPSVDAPVNVTENNDTKTSDAGTIEVETREKMVDEKRKWVQVQVCVFKHRPEGWPLTVKIVARRFRVEGELPGTWHYGFLGTNLEAADLPRALVRRHGFGPMVWMLYNTKQGHENHFKTPLEDFGLHHPPSGRLGVNEAFFAVAFAAVNVAMVIRYGVLPKEERGMRWWRVCAVYGRIAGVVVRHAGGIVVRLAGGCMSLARRKLWLEAFASAGRL